MEDISITVPKSNSFNTPPTSPTLHSPTSPTSLNRSPRTPNTSTPSTPTFLIDTLSFPAHSLENPSSPLRSPHHNSPRIQRTFAQRLGQQAYERERGGSIGERGERERALSSEAVLDIVPQQEDGSEKRIERLDRPKRREESAKEIARGEPGEQLLSTSEDIFVIPPQLSIDEKLFQDEVILWSHYVKLSESLKQPQSIFNFIFFFFFFITTIILAVMAHKYLSMRAVVVTLWLMAPILFFSGFLQAQTLLEHTCYFITNYRVIQCRLLGARITSKSMAYPGITDIRIGPNSISIFARHNYAFLKFIGLDQPQLRAVNRILQQQRENQSQIGPIDSPQSLDTQHIPEKYVHLIHSADMPFLEVNRATSLTGKYLWGSVKFAVVYLWIGGILVLTQASRGWMIPYFLSIVLLPIIFLLTNTLDKVDILGTRSLIFLRVGLAYIKECHYGRNALRLGYESAYPLVCSYNVKNNNGDIQFYNYTFANVCSEDVIATEEIIFHKYLDAIRSATS